MKYERITTRRETPFVMSMWAGDSESLKIYNRLVELENKIENGEMVSIVQSEQGEQEIAFFVKHNAEVRKQAVKEFAEKLRDKEFPVNIGTEWCAVVKSRDIIDELVKVVCGK